MELTWTGIAGEEGVGGLRARSWGGAGGGDGFYLLRGVKLPDTHNCTVDAGATLEECERRCLANCSCTAYSAADIRGGGSGCIQWFDDLMDTRFSTAGRTSMSGLHRLN